jgi:hypothetical protein
VRGPTSPPLARPTASPSPLPRTHDLGREKPPLSHSLPALAWITRELWLLPFVLLLVSPLPLLPFPSPPPCPARRPLPMAPLHATTHPRRAPCPARWPLRAALPHAALPHAARPPGVAPLPTTALARALPCIMAAPACTLASPVRRPQCPRRGAQPRRAPMRRALPLRALPCHGLRPSAPRPHCGEPAPARPLSRGTLPRRAPARRPLPSVASVRRHLSLARPLAPV